MMFLTIFENVFRCPVNEIEAILDRRDLENTVRRFDGFDIDFRQASMPDQPFFLHGFYRFKLVLHFAIRADTV